MINGVSFDSIQMRAKRPGGPPAGHGRTSTRAPSAKSGKRGCHHRFALAQS